MQEEENELVYPPPHPALETGDQAFIARGPGLRKVLGINGKFLEVCLGRRHFLSSCTGRFDSLTETIHFCDTESRMFHLSQ